MTTPHEDEELTNWAEAYLRVHPSEVAVLDHLAKKCVTVSRRKGFGDTDVWRDTDPEIFKIVEDLKRVHDRVEALRDYPSDEAGPVRYMLLIATECYETIEAIMEHWALADGGDPSLPSDLVPAASFSLARNPNKPEGPGPEAVDILIRWFDYCGRFNVPAGSLMATKHAYNMGRPRLHGRESV